MIILGKRIKELRESNQLKQREFADIIGVDPSTINKYESGKILPDLIKLIKIADYFDVSLDFLVGRKEY